MYGFSDELITGCIIELFCKTFIGFIKDEFEYCGHPNEIGRQLVQFALSECPTYEFQKKRAIELRVKHRNIRLCQSARPTMEASRNKSCGRRSPSAGASRSMPAPTNMVSRKRCGPLAGRCSGRRRSPSRCTVVVGDNPDSEIEAGNRLGMKTIQ